jgi:hypothetical protein
MSCGTSRGNSGTSPSAALWRFFGPSAAGIVRNLVDVQVVAIDPSAALRKALRMWLPRTAVAVDHFHLISLANRAMTEARQYLSQQVKGRRGSRLPDEPRPKAILHRMQMVK